MVRIRVSLPATRQARAPTTWRCDLPSNLPLAHARKDADGWHEHPLHDHLVATGELAGAFAEAFDSSEWARLAGRWHDLGKARPSFQAYLRAVTGYDGTITAPARVDHSSAGAIHACEELGPIGRIIAYIIAGHHAGLPDWDSTETGRAALAQRLEQPGLLADALSTGTLAADVLSRGASLGPPPTKGTAVEREALHLWIRMLYSCVVDADFIDTERFFDAGRSEQRTGWPELEVLRLRLEEHQRAMVPRRDIDAVRSRVRDQVIAKAGLEPGFFSLTVPTGGGKTLTSLRFALEHARIHGHRRVIYAIPYLSIIEQTAHEFRRAVGDGVLEHHSNLDPDTSDPRQRAATENWDAPLVVTTVVQLFESLFASRLSRSRKVHNMASSIIVLDEAQLLPPDFLEPILGVLRGLVAAFGVTVVLCTATQPALGTRSAAVGAGVRGIDGVRELVDDAAALHHELIRVDVQWPTDVDQRQDWMSIADQLAAEHQVLCIVNSRADCRDLVAAMPNEADAVHLSALMCAQHRMNVLRDVRQRLAADLPLRLISTQLIEAGVDIDFPVVYRALAGLDSIAQASGRCNREGRAHRGRVVVFVPPKPAPIGHLRRAEQATRSLLAVMDEEHLLWPSAFQRYFERLYADGSLDRREIQPLLVAGASRAEFQFRTAAERFQMVDDAGAATVIVPYGRGEALLRELRAAAGRPMGTPKGLLRRLQRFTVSIHAGQLAALKGAGVVSEVLPQVFALDDPGRYDVRLGLLTDDGSRFIPDLVV